MAKLVRIELNGEEYFWRNGAWYDRTYIKPPRVIVHQLEQLLWQQQSQVTVEIPPAIQQITDVQLLKQSAYEAREAQEYQRAEQLTRRVLALQPDDVGAMATLCSVLRRRARPADALAASDRLRHVPSAMLLTSRAGAYCDLGQWEAAVREIGRALALKNSHEAQNVVARIKAARPDLYT